MQTSNSTQLRRGVLEMGILALLKARPAYGAELIASLGKVSALASSGGTVYPILTRLEKSGDVRSEWNIQAGSPRKYYSITEAGTRRLGEQIETWRSLQGAIEVLIGEVS